MKSFTREDFYEQTKAIPAADRRKELRAAARRDSAHSGYLPSDLIEALMIRLAGWSPGEELETEPRAVFVFAADNAIAGEGGLMDSLAPATVDLVQKLREGGAVVGRLARRTGTQLIPVNLGVAGLDKDLEGVVHAPVIPEGSRNFLLEDALTEEAMMTAVRLGMEFSAQAASRGFRLLIGAEAAASSCLSATAVIAALTGRPPDELLPKGPALPDEIFSRRLHVLTEALEKREPDRYNAFEVLRKVGGLDIAALVGFYAGAAVYGVPLLLDGQVTLAAALTVVRLLPETRTLFFASQTPADPGSERVIRELGLTPLLDTALDYPGGAGALFMLPLLDLARALFEE